ncbi:MAG: dephospho-CoA kinase [Ruminococcaceae bacterium]|nr:dephospho-CoA kinase [Oscillospiraceae bacterium]
MKVIGITGGIGAGKSTVCAEFEKYGVFVVDADKISRQVTAKNGAAYGEIADYFGKSVIMENGEINRKKLAEIVFSDSNELEMLNRITHKHIFSEMRKAIDLSESDIILLDVPLLFSSDFDIECDLKIAVIADLESRINRVMKRDNTDRESVISRIKVQLSDDEFKRCADLCIYNDSSEEMQKQVKNIIESVRS